MAFVVLLCCGAGLCEFVDLHRVMAAQEEEAAGNVNIDPHTVTKLLRVRKPG